uniref:Impact N-terminal domain-containing protein n=1 Tax=Grammatophora oceanica TaxID=210454 RepID=A0A7S1UNP0_9STRA|mmetsp:Transcript_14623/g.21529  ORF Transcript_14623/g.21529 Transcript_14623/m.21529 type:complete len:282 (+) Transcript_14623:110-955(+)
MEDQEESLERAASDIEIAEAAFPDEVLVVGPLDAFPLTFQLCLDDGGAFLALMLPVGYPAHSGLEIISYRSKPKDKVRIDAVAAAVRQTAQDCLEQEMEACMACCSAAIEAWNEAEHLNSPPVREDETPMSSLVRTAPSYEWLSGVPLTDRKSTFQGHACLVKTEQQVYDAIRELIDGSNRIQRAYHNMYAWRLTEVLPDGKHVLKHDNDDDGEDAAGSRLAQLLHSRQDDGVVVVVSRWYGRIKLGPKRFAHITNCAREVLVEICDAGEEGNKKADKRKK